MVTQPHCHGLSAIEVECDVVIVGGGPAGCTCALYTSRADLKTARFLFGAVAVGRGDFGSSPVENSQPFYVDQLFFSNKAMKAMKAMAAMKAMRAMKKKAVSKIAKSKNAKLVVFNGTKEKTMSGLKRILRRFGASVKSRSLTDENSDQTLPI